MRRLSVSLLLLLLIGIIAAGWGIDKLFTQLYPSEDNGLQIAKSVGAKLAQAIDTHEANEPLGDSIRIMQYEELALPPTLQNELEQGQSITLESDTGIDLYFDLPKTKRVLSLSIPHISSNDTPIRLLLTMLFYSCVILLVLAWLYPLIRRLRKLETTAKAFGEGELDRRVPTHARSQLHSIETEFNRMAQRIDGLVGDNKLLSSAVSHDLRTPLARLRFGVDALQESVQDDDGPGIPANARKNVLKPFIRNTDQQGKHGTSYGYGLGLAIVSRIAEWHQADLQIKDSSLLGGASISVRFNHNVRSNLHKSATAET